MGFEQPEVDGVLLGCDRGEEEPEKAIKCGQPPVTKAGDVWLLGRHRIACGDATDPGAYAQLLEGCAADMVFTDPPYGCPVDGFVSSRGHREFVQGSGEMDARWLTGFFERWCEQLKNYSVPGAVVELCIDWRSLHSLMNAAGPVFGDPINMAVWVKDRAGMGSFLRSQHELVLIYCTPGATYRNNVELGRHGRNRTNVWKYPSAMSFAHSGAEGDLLDDHPTPKPKDMVADAILDCTARGAVVLDPFIGSGSTLIASEKTGRVCRGMDLDPLYVDLAVRRWQAWTGQQAVHAHDARRFDDIGQETAASLEGASHD
jgi:DNA modification methylase